LIIAACGFLAEIKFAATFLKREDLPFQALNRGYPPSSIPRKVLLGAGSAKMAGKILMSKNLEVKILGTNDLGRDDAVSAHRHCLDHHYANLIVAQG
jgi:hypothetical protein